LLAAKRAKSLFRRAGDGRVLNRMELPLVGLRVAFGFLVLPRQSPQVVSALSTLLGSSSPLGNLQTTFALHSLAASVEKSGTKTDVAAELPSNLLEWPRRKEETLR
ncbi:hypothetical protein, partial [uncultured Rikenella sp.]